MTGIQFAFTMDYDWASEAVIEYALKQFVKANIPLTVFATHNSMYVNEVASNTANIEIEIHPNFCRNSSHGTTQEEVFEYCKTIGSEGLGFRSHRFFCNNDIYEYYKSQGFKYSSNICTDLEYVKPFKNRVGLLEIPIFMEDGGYLFQGHKLDLQEVVSNIQRKTPYNERTTIVFLFHPMHIAFNTIDFAEMKYYKQSMSIQDYRAISLEDIQEKRKTTKGISNLVEDICNWSEVNNIRKVLLKDVYNEWKTLCV